MRTFVAALLSLAVLVAACGDDTSTDGGTTTESTTSTSTPASSTTTGGDGGDSTTTEPMELTASWDGVTADTIRLGFVEIDFPELNRTGLYQSNRGDPRTIIAAFVDELNERGGILGRQVEAFPEVIMPINPVDAEASCVRLTEDNDVFAVLGQFAGPTSSINGCFSDQGETITIGGNPTPAQLAAAKAPWLSTGMGSERRLLAAIGLMHDEGLFGERLAVATAIAGEEVTDNIVLPELDRLGYDVVDKFVQNADAGDRPALAGDWALFIERFRTENVDTVVLVASDAAVNGSNQLRLQGWEGDILIVDAVNTLGEIGGTGENPPEALEGIVGTMGATAEESFDLEATRECVEILEASDPTITVYRRDQVPEGETDWVPELLGICSKLQLFEMIAIDAGADLNPTTFLAAAEQLGEVDLAGSPFASLGPDKLDASDNLRLAEFDASVDADGGSRPLGPLMQIPG